MYSLSTLLGSSTRGNLVGALARADSPLTSYEVAKMYNMNVAKVYGEMKRLKEMGLVEAVPGRRGTGYKLVDDDLKRLALRLSPRVTTLEAWRSEDERRSRFMNGLREVPEFLLQRPEVQVDEKPSRFGGELRSLAVLGRRMFDSKYRRTGERAWSRTSD